MCVCVHNTYMYFRKFIIGPFSLFLIHNKIIGWSLSQLIFSGLFSFSPIAPYAGFSSPWFWFFWGWVGVVDKNVVVLLAPAGISLVLESVGAIIFLIPSVLIPFVVLKNSWHRCRCWIGEAVGPWNQNGMWTSLVHSPIPLGIWENWLWRLVSLPEILEPKFSVYGSAGLSESLNTPKYLLTGLLSFSAPCSPVTSEGQNVFRFLRTW